MTRLFYEPNAKIKLAYTDEGYGEEVLVFIHGFASQLDIWEKNIVDLSKKYRCIAIDLPGHGMSTHGNYSYSQRFYIDTLKHLFKYLKVEDFTKVSLVAHSMGGQIAIRLALEMNNVWNKLILVAPAGFEEFTEQEKVIIAKFASVNILNASQYWKIHLNLKDFFFNLEDKEYQKLQELNSDFYSIIKNPFLTNILKGSVTGMLYEPVFHDLHNISIPTLVFFGENDKLIPNTYFHKDITTAEVAKNGVEKINDAVLKLYVNCGHFLQYEYPQAFNTEVENFLN